MVMWEIIILIIHLSLNQIIIIITIIIIISIQKHVKQKLSIILILSPILTLIQYQIIMLDRILIIKNKLILEQVVTLGNKVWDQMEKPIVII
jgi:hypothetical protein